MLNTSLTLAGKMAQWVMVFATKPDDVSSIPGTPVVEKTDSCMFSSGLHMGTHTLTCPSASLIKTIKKKLVKKKESTILTLWMLRNLIVIESRPIFSSLFRKQS